MSPLSPVAIDDELRRLAHMLEERTEELAQRAQEAAEAEAAWKLAAAKTTVRLASMPVKMTVDEREARVLQEHADLFRTFKLSEAARDSAKEGCRSLRTQIDAVRSVGANIRELVK